MELNRTQMWLVSPNASEIKEKLGWQVRVENLTPVDLEFKSWVDNGAREWCDAVEALDKQCGHDLYLRSAHERRWPHWK